MVGLDYYFFLKKKRNPSRSERTFIERIDIVGRFKEKLNEEFRDNLRSRRLGTITRKASVAISGFQKNPGIDHKELLRQFVPLFDYLRQLNWESLVKYENHPPPHWDDEAEPRLATVFRVAWYRYCDYNRCTIENFCNFCRNLFYGIYTPAANVNRLQAEQIENQRKIEELACKIEETQKEIDLRRGTFNALRSRVK